MENAWLAEAEYEDGTSVSRLFEPNDSIHEDEDQFRLEEWLLSRHPGCTWYSVTWI